MGATTIEKHYTLDKNLPGPDHPFAVEPHELKEMVDYIRQAEIAMLPLNGKTFTESEEAFSTGMRSIVAKTPIKKGDILTIDNITTKRPYLKGNIAAAEWFNTLGKVADKDYQEDDFL